MQARLKLAACSTYEAYQQIVRLQGLGVESKAQRSQCAGFLEFLHAGIGISAGSIACIELLVSHLHCCGLSASKTRQKWRMHMHIAFPSGAPAVASCRKRLAFFCWPERLGRSPH